MIHPRRVPRLPTVLSLLALLSILAGSVVVLARDAIDSTTAASGTPLIFAPAVGADGAPLPTAGTAGGPDSGQTDPGAAGGPGTTGALAGGDAPLTASDVGVTAEEINLGAILIRCADCGSFGAPLSRHLPAITQVLVDDINRRGGINGRRVELTVSQFDPIADALNGGDSERQSCIDITEQARSFAVISVGASRPACMYDEHATPVLAPYPTSEADPDTFNRTEGRIWLVNPTARRTLTNWADRLASEGLLRSDEPFGIVTTEALDYDGPVRDVLVPALQARGLDPARVSVLPPDYASQPSAAAVEGASMRSDGINTVLLAGDIGGMLVFVQDAQRNDWSPQWMLTDYGLPANEVGASVMPSAFVGATAVSVEGPIGSPVQPSPAYARCHQLWEAYAGGPTAPEDELFLVYLCDLLSMFEQGAARAGPNLTRRTLAQGLAAIGTFDVASLVGGRGSLGGPYAFGPVKWSVGIATVVKRYDGDVYRVVSGPAPMGG